MSLCIIIVRARARTYTDKYGGYLKTEKNVPILIFLKRRFVKILSCARPSASSAQTSFSS